MPQKTITATMLLIVKDGSLLLAMKKRGFGKGKWNGPGGKLRHNETPEEACIRETQEELGITPLNIQKVAEHVFLYPATSETVIGHIFLATSFTGTPTESEEMAPQWFALCDIPYQQMWDDDIYWLPAVLTGRKLRCSFTFDQDNKLASSHIKEVAEIQ